MDLVGLTQGIGQGDRNLVSGLTRKRNRRVRDCHIKFSTFDKAIYFTRG